MKLDSSARAKGAEKANAARSAWEEQALALYAQSLHEQPALRPKERRYAVTKWMNEHSVHPRQITDAMMLAALRRPDTKGTLAVFKEMFEAPKTDKPLADEEEAEITEIAEGMARSSEDGYSKAFGTFTSAVAAFRAACIKAGRTDAFANEVQRAVKAVRDKAPARAKSGSAKK